MLFGAIIGDIAGSVYEFANIRSKNFPFMTDPAMYPPRPGLL